MRAFAVWLAIALAGYGGLAGAYHGYLAAHPRRVLVVIDASFDMRTAWTRIDAVLDEIGARRYHEFALFTDKSRVHGWAGRFSPGRIAPYAPRDLSRLESLATEREFGEADEVVLVTNAAADATRGFGEWTIVRVR